MNITLDRVFRGTYNQLLKSMYSLLDEDTMKLNKEEAIHSFLNSWDIFSDDEIAELLDLGGEVSQELRIKFIAESVAIRMDGFLNTIQEFVQIILECSGTPADEKEMTELCDAGWVKEAYNTYQELA